MKAVIGLQLMLIGVCCGVESSCNAKKKGVHCFGALGGAVNLRIMDKTSKPSMFIIAKKRSELFRWKAHRIIARTKDKRFSFFPNNGTVRITNLKRRDSGAYRLTMVKKGRKNTRTLKLFIEAPVSSVWLVSKCTSSGKQRVFCFPEAGDKHLCKWTMNKKPLKNAKSYFGYVATCTILLGRKKTGLLGCSISNHISHSYKDMKITSCAAKERTKLEEERKKILMSSNTSSCIQFLKKIDGANKKIVPPKLPAKKKDGSKKPIVLPKVPTNKDRSKNPIVPTKLSAKKKEGSKKPNVPPKLPAKKKDGSNKPTVPPKLSAKKKEGSKQPIVPSKLTAKKDGSKKPIVPPKLPAKKDGSKKPIVPPKLTPKHKDGANKPTVPPKLSGKKGVSKKPIVPPKLPAKKDGSKTPIVPPKLTPKQKDGANKPTVPPKLR